MPPAPTPNGSVAAETPKSVAAGDEDDAAALADQLGGLNLPRGSQVKVLMQGVQQAHGRISQLQDENRTLRARLAALEKGDAAAPGTQAAARTQAQAAYGKGAPNSQRPRAPSPPKPRRAEDQEAKEWKAMYVDALKKLRDAQQELAAQQGKSEQLQEQVRSLQDSDGASLTSASPSVRSQSTTSQVGYQPYAGSSPAATPSSQYTVYQSDEIQPDDAYRAGMDDHTLEARRKLPPVRTSRVVQKTVSSRSKTHPKWMQSLLSCVSNSEVHQPKQ